MLGAAQTTIGGMQKKITAAVLNTVTEAIEKGRKAADAACQLRGGRRR